MKLFRRMQILAAKVRVFGFAGIWGYLRGRRMFWSRVKFFKSRFVSTITPRRGISLIGQMSDTSSLSKTMRDFALCLQDAGIEFQTIDTTNIKGDLDSSSCLCINKFDHVFVMFSNSALDAAGIYAHKIVFWEFDSGFAVAHPEMLDSKSIVCFSDFNYRYMKSVFGDSANVSKILYPFRFEDDITQEESDLWRMRLGLRKTDFVVFYNFDFRTSYNRKNPEGVVKAFAKAFHGRRDVSLVLKTNGLSSCEHEYNALRSLMKRLGVDSQVQFVNSYISQRELYALTKASDVYCSLNRGEGFGLGIAEAMSMGLAVVLTDWSAPLEFCDDSNSILIPCKMVKVPSEEKDLLLYQWVECWPEPDLELAATALLRLYNNESLRAELGRKAKDSIHRYFSIDNFRASVMSFLESSAPTFH